MIISLGILSVFQLAFLPGLVFTRLVKLQGFWETILLSIALSPIINYVFVFVTAVLGIYNRPSVFVFLGTEIILLIYLSRPFLSTTCEQLFKSMKVVRFFKEYLDSDKSGWVGVFTKALLALLLGLAAYHVWCSLRIYANQEHSVFAVWDAVVSWGRWAVDWYNSDLPRMTWHYPQLIPANWSLTHQFVGDSYIKLFAKHYMALIEVFVLVTVFALGIIKRHAGYFIAVTLTAWLQSALGSNGNGNVDTSVAFFALSAVACLLLARNSKNRSIYIYVGAAIAAGAAVTKQAGLWMAICFPLLMILSTIKGSRRESLGYMRGIALIYLLLIVPWYGYKEYQIRRGEDASEVQLVTSLASRGKNASQTFGSAIDLLETAVETPRLSGRSCLVVLSVLVLFSCRDLFFAGLTGLVIVPFVLIWVFFFSYDTRNVNMVVPLVGMAAGMGIKNIIDVVINRLAVFDRCINNRLQTHVKVLVSIRAVYLTIPVLAIFLLPIKYTDGYMIGKSIAKQKEMGEPELNKRLYSYQEEHGLNGKILTDYQYLGSLPGLEQYYQLGFSNTRDTFIQQFNRPEIGYALVRRGWMSPEVESYIDRLVANEKIEVIFEYDTFLLVTTCRGPVPDH